MRGQARSTQWMRVALWSGVCVGAMVMILTVVASV